MTYGGVAGDRVFAFVDPAKTSNFPWVTAREVPEMALFRPRYLEPASEDKHFPEARTYRVEVTTPEGTRPTWKTRRSWRRWSGGGSVR
ncbi:MAG TPA: hypothetical protein VFA60_03600 [Terriglobales bacterium]|nr:hypothetical protein [Terriglobales bacterium]